MNRFDLWKVTSAWWFHVLILEKRRSGNNSADVQNEKDKIFRQLKEIETYKVKIDELLSEGYSPILDDGVGKNITHLDKNRHEFEFGKLVDLFEQTQFELREQAARSVDIALVVRNWLFGWYIVEFEQNGSDWAEYGSKLLKHLSMALSKKLTKIFNG